MAPELKKFLDCGMYKYPIGVNRDKRGETYVYCQCTLLFVLQPTKLLAIGSVVESYKDEIKALAKRERLEYREAKKMPTPMNPSVGVAYYAWRRPSVDVDDSKLMKLVETRKVQQSPSPASVIDWAEMPGVRLEYNPSVIGTTRYNITYDELEDIIS